jgi:type I restriction enzyme R subunit
MRGETTVNKKSMSERDICTKFITPAIEDAGWDRMTQYREEVTFTAGKIIVRGNLVTRGDKERADYILYYKPNLPIGLIEAKDNNHTVGEGMQQGLKYAKKLDIPFVFSSNGDGFIFHNRFTGKEIELPLNGFPSPETLWQQFKQAKGISTAEEPVITQDYYFGQDQKKPRYYQVVAVNRAIEDIIKGRDRMLLVMATGTGKTYVASQIIYRLWKSKSKKRILFLADRNNLVDQTINNDFKHFGDKMYKIKNREANKSYEIYLALYQAVSGTEEEQNIYKQFSPDFFDLVIVDECHRGSAKEDSAWRDILEYYSSATQIGLTATPKETHDVSNTDYFGEAIYTYSLKQGIQDGFLAPYKVIRVMIDKDVEGYRPERGKEDKYGYEIEDRIYNATDYDRKLVIEPRTELVAKKISEYLKKTDRFSKTIVFCVDIAHAERMRQAFVNENSDLIQENHKYVMRITGDSPEGKAELDNFIDVDSKYPVIVTTSKLLTTGVDAQTCKVIALDANINSMTEFKQIIGRGTRVREDYGKEYFTIIDFRDATRLFADPEFDGEPVKSYDTDGHGDMLPPDEGIDGTPIDDNEGTEIPPDITIDMGDDKPAKYYVDDVEVMVIKERVMYYDKDGKLITESLKDYTKKNIQKEFSSMDEFLRRWSKADRKDAIIAELREMGVLFEELQEEIGKDLDPFDLILHIVYDQKPLTRQERADNVKKRNYFTKYEEQASAVLQALLDKYADAGIENMEAIEVLNLDPFKQIGTPNKIIKLFGNKVKYIAAVKELEKELYA